MNTDQPPASHKKINRRKFVKSTAAAAFGFQFLPSTVWGANERLNVACIGVGGKGAGEVKDIAAAGGNIVALCDVDKHQRTNASTSNHPNAAFYQDYREMLAKEDKNIDAVSVSTPDHIHCLAAVAAMSLGKHVYCQKPLSHSVWEARLMTAAAKKFKVATQMGNQAHAGEPIRRAVELIRAGLIGKVKEVHCWTNRPIWPQGMNERPVPHKVPANLDWDLWLGPAAYRPFAPYDKKGKDKATGYVPFAWRGWWDFGTGALGDMGCHIMDMPYWALELGSPLTVEADQNGNTIESGPNDSVVTYTFPKGKYNDDLIFKWYDGGRMPDKEVFADTKLDPKTAKMFDLIMIGEKGKFAFQRTRQPRVTFPENLIDDCTPQKTIARVPNEDAEWLAACKGGPAALSNFSYSGPFTETVLLGNLAVRHGKKINWDAKHLCAKDAPEVDKLIKRKYRDGWDIPGAAGILNG